MFALIGLVRMFSVAALVVLACACSRGEASSQHATTGDAGEADTQRQPIRAGRTAIRTIRPTIVLPGTIAPREIVALSNSINEPTSAVYVREGDRVHAGEALADLDVSDLQASLRSAIETGASDVARTSATTYSAQLVFSQAPQQVRQARAALAQAIAATQEARRNLARDERLGEEGYLPTQNVDEQGVVVRSDLAAEGSARAAVASALANQVQNGTPASGLQAATIDEQRRAANAANATVDQLRSEISRAHIVSPIDGFVINRNLNAGEYPTGRQIFTIEDADSVYAVLTASAVAADEIRVGDVVAVTRPGFRGGSFRGRVEALLDAGTPGSTNFTVKVSVPNAGHRLRAGTPVEAVVDLGAIRGVAVPATAFTNDARDAVITIEDGRARERRVSEVATDGVSSIVDGIGAGGSIALDGTVSVHDGQAVTATH